jgi:hypothetical protein
MGSLDMALSPNGCEHFFWHPRTVQWKAFRLKSLCGGGTTGITQGQLKQHSSDRGRAESSWPVKILVPISYLQLIVTTRVRISAICQAELLEQSWPET